MVSGQFDQELEEQLYELNGLFFPRSHWSNPDPFDSEQIAQLLLLMYSAKKRGLLTVHEEVIETHRFEPFPAYDSMSEQDLGLWRVAAARRGARDLKDEAWSAIQYLRKRFPRARLRPHSGGVAYCCAACRARTA